jgi:hypothetical protein
MIKRKQAMPMDSPIVFRIEKVLFFLKLLQAVLK